MSTTKSLEFIQVSRIVSRLPMRFKIRLAQQLDKETWQERMRRIVANVRRRAKKNPISEEEITRLCEEVRQELYEKEIKRPR